MKKRWPAVLALLILVVGVFVYLYFLHPEAVPMWAELGPKVEGPTTYLIYGRDLALVEDSDDTVEVETDLVITVTLDPATRSVDVLFIPPNTLIRKEEEFKHIYAVEGVDGLKKAVEALTEKTIDRYIGIDYQPFVQLIDVLNGIEVRMNETIDLPKYGLYITPGINKLNGEETLKLVRLKRGTTTVIERIERQKTVLSAIYQRVTEINNLSQLKNVQDAILNIREKLETDIDSSHIIKGFQFFTQGVTTMTVEILPGELIEEEWIPSILADELLDQAEFEISSESEEDVESQSHND